MFSARWLWPRAGEWIEDGGLLVRTGRIARVVRGRAALRRAARTAQRVELGDGLLTPGLVDAHAHLELSLLAGSLPRACDMPTWIAALLAVQRSGGAGQPSEAVRRGAEQLLAGGVTCVGDIDASGEARAALARTPLRARSYRELLDAGDATRTPAVVRRLAAVRASRAHSGRMLSGLAPHAPYTLSAELLAAIARRAARGGVQWMVHWAETAEEEAWLRAGRGPFERLLRTTPRTGGLELLERAGLLGPHTALVHGNAPARGEIARVAASGAVVVHCPGCHAHFERPPFPLRAYLAAGVPIALGTDSLASNAALDLPRELRLLREGAPWLAPERALDMATRVAARALGLVGAAGELAPRARADFALWTCAASTRAGWLDALTLARAQFEGAWIDGRPAAGRAAGLDSAGPARRSRASRTRRSTSDA